MTGLWRFGGRIASIVRACYPVSMAAGAGEGAGRLPGASTIGAAATAKAIAAAMPRKIGRFRILTSVECPDGASPLAASFVTRVRRQRCHRRFGSTAQGRNDDGRGKQGVQHEAELRH